MSTKDFTANVISATKVVPDGNFKDSKASGIWDINEALDLIKGGNWPNAANVNPAAFVDALFQTHLYTGTSANRSIVNGIDLSGKGGLVWTKVRTQADSHYLFDTERGVNKRLSSNSTAAQQDETAALTAFNSNGFSLGNVTAFNGNAANWGSAGNYVSWTFRKQPKFFDVVKYEGTGSARTVAHSLNTTVGMIIVKNLDAGDNWAVYHRANTAAPQTDYLILNDTGATADDSAWWNDTAPTSSVFTVGTDHAVNASGENYVAYLFAHNNDDGGFGEPGDQDIIKCGSYTGNGNADGPDVTLGFEPQWLIVKNASANSTNWEMLDVMRGMFNDGASTDARIRANANAAEASSDFAQPTPTGFKVTSDGSNMNGNGNTMIYMAIRRGGMQTPTAASDVFAIDTGTGDHNASFPIDLTMNKRRVNAASTYVTSRLTGDKYLATNSTSVEGSFNFDNLFDDMTGVDFTGGNGWYDTSDTIGWMWKRARGYFDIVTYTGTSPNAGDTKSHNLGVVPEMIWLKNRNGASGGARSWMVYHKQTANTGYLKLDANSALITSDPQDKFGNNTVGVSPTASVFTVAGDYQVNYDGDTYIAYLFATVAGVSKVGSFTQSGATNVACGFTGDTPSFILLKRTDATGNWYLFDSARGIVAGNDKSLYLNTTDAEVTNADVVDPYSGGFATTSSLTNGDYIFYAIASIA